MPLASGNLDRVRRLESLEPDIRQEAQEAQEACDSVWWCRPARADGQARWSSYRVRVQAVLQQSWSRLQRIRRGCAQVQTAVRFVSWAQLQHM